jgi:hypothetical protein
LTGGFGVVRDRPDGRPDLYLQNPAWRGLMLLSNFNSAEYDAVVLEFVRRLFRNWQLEGSYTYSEAIGDAEDFDLLLGNEQNLRDDERGFLDFDQRHVAKLNLTTHLAHGWNVGTVVRWESGLPYSIISEQLVDFNLPPIYPVVPSSAELVRFGFPTGQRNDHRNPSTWTFDLRLARDFTLGRGDLIQFSVEAFNLFNDGTLRLDSRNEGRNVGTQRFGRRWQLGMRLTF